MCCYSVIIAMTHLGTGALTLSTREYLSLELNRSPEIANSDSLYQLYLVNETGDHFEKVSQSLFDCKI